MRARKIKVSQSARHPVERMSTCMRPYSDIVGVLSRVSGYKLARSAFT